MWVFYLNVTQESIKLARYQHVCIPRVKVKWWYKKVLNWLGIRTCIARLTAVAYWSYPRFPTPSKDQLLASCKYTMYKYKYTVHTQALCTNKNTHCQHTNTSTGHTPAPNPIKGSTASKLQIHYVQAQIHCTNTNTHCQHKDTSTPRPPQNYYVPI